MTVRRIIQGKVISELGLGCSSYWGRPTFAAELAIDLVQQAMAGGLNNYDTGPSYGAGTAESRLGRALQNAPRAPLFISTKGGTFVDAKGHMQRSFAPSVLREQLFRSLDRLRTDHVDIYYLHGPAPADLSDAVLDFLQASKAQGLIRWSGVDSSDPVVLQRIVSLPIDVVMAPYNLTDQRCGATFAPLQKAGKTIFGGAALGQMRFIPSTFLPSSKKALWYLLRALKNDPGFLFSGAQIRCEIAASGLSPAEAALNFVLNTQALTSSFFGTTSAAHLAHNLAWLHAYQETTGAGQAAQIRSEPNDISRI